MKLFRQLSCFLAAAAFCGAAFQSHAQHLTQSYVNDFDTSSSLASWLYWYDIEGGAVPWNSSVDAANNPNSGSMMVSIPWSGTSDQQTWFGTWDNQYEYDTSLTMNGAYITNISCDILVDPSSPTNADGNFGTIEIGFYPGPVFWSASSVTLPLTAANGWMHVSIPVDTTTSGLTSVSGICFDMNTYSATLNGTTLFYVDNLTTEATPYYTNTFDASSSAASWIYWYGINPGNSAMVWDSTMDANSNSGSGSLSISIDWTNSATGNATGANEGQAMFGTFANRYGYDYGQKTDADNFQNILCSVHVDPSSPTNAAGNYGVLQIGFMSSVSGSITWPAGSVTLLPNATNGWTNIVVPIDITTPGLSSNIAGIFLQMQTYGGQGGGLPGTTLLWVDNLGLQAMAAPLPAPTMAGLTKPVQGLNFTPTLTGPNDNDDRYSICTDNVTNFAGDSAGNGNLYGWFGASGPVTYSVTLNEFPGQSASGYQQHIFMIPGQVGSEVAPDYNETNCIFITVQYEPFATNTYFTNGGVITTNTTTNWYDVMDFRYKTNNSFSNGMLFNALSPTNVTNVNQWPVEPVGQVRDTTALGTWSVTFNQNTNVTLTSPSGNTTNFVMDAASAALFADPLTVYVGAQPNSAAGYGQLCNVTQFSITGSGTPLSDNFLTDTSLNSSLWQEVTSDTNAIVLVPAGQAYWVSWSIPDVGFDLQTSATLIGTNRVFLTGPNASNPSAVTTVVQQGKVRKALVPTVSLPSPTTGFFDLIKDQ